MRILLSGGFGFLGTRLARELGDGLGHRIRILAPRLPDFLGAWREKYEILRGDVTDRAGLAGACADCDVVIQLASLSRPAARLNPGLALAVGATGTRNLLEEAARAGVGRFIFFSTCHVYGRPRTGRVSERSPVSPMDEYSLAHYAGESYCRQFQGREGLETITLRLANGFGAPVDRRIDCWSLIVQEFCLSAFRQRKIVLRSEGLQKRDFVSVPEIVRAVRILIEAPSARLRHDLYNLGSGRPVSLRALAERVRRIGRDLYGRAITVERPAPGTVPERAHSLAVDIRRIRGLGFRPGPPGVMDREIAGIFRVLESPSS